jgi:hypothetical protein
MPILGVSISNLCECSHRSKQSTKWIDDTIQEPHMPLVLKFLDLGANVQATLDNDKRATALYLAPKNGHLVIVEVLI